MGSLTLRSWRRSLLLLPLLLLADLVFLLAQYVLMDNGKRRAHGAMMFHHRCSWSARRCFPAAAVSCCSFASSLLRAQRAYLGRNHETRHCNSLLLRLLLLLLAIFS